MQNIHHCSFCKNKSHQVDTGASHIVIQCQYKWDVLCNNYLLDQYLLRNGVNPLHSAVGMMIVLPQLLPNTEPYSVLGTFTLSHIHSQISMYRRLQPHYSMVSKTFSHGPEYHTDY